MTQTNETPVETVRPEDWITVKQAEELHPGTAHTVFYDAAMKGEIRTRTDFGIRLLYREDVENWKPRGRGRPRKEVKTDE